MIKQIVVIIKNKVKIKHKLNGKNKIEIRIKKIIEIQVMILK